MNKFLRGLSLWFVVILGILFFSSLLKLGQEKVSISYSEFKKLIKEKKVIECIISSYIIEGRYETTEGVVKPFRTVTVDDPKLTDQLDKAGINYRGERRKNWLSAIFMNFGPILLFLFLWFLMIRSMQTGGSQAMSFGRTRARLYQQSKERITFTDVAGVDESKEELQEIIAFLKDPKKFQKLGGKIPKGVLLYGPPGSGKTLLAKAVAGEAGVPFFSVSGSEFVEMFVGVGASRVRDLFNLGRKNAPCLLFIDEIDAVGRFRFAGIGGGHDEREQTLNQLLVEMDGFDTKEGVILIAATNRPDVLDAALLRPGRFDRHIAVPSPDLKGREEILKIHTRGIKLSPEIDLKIIARRTPGFVGSDLANLANEAALLAARKNKDKVEMEDLEEAIDRVIAGPERKSRMISEKEKKIISYHESGHTIVSKLLPDADPIHKVSIIPRGPALGYTLQLPIEDRYLTTKSELLTKITVLLAGRAAEELVFKEITTGAQNDFQKATGIVHKMVYEYGMGKETGLLSYRGKSSTEVFLGRDLVKEKIYSEKTAEILDKEVKRIIDSCYERARKILTENRKKLDLLSKYLIEKEMITGEEVTSILEKGSLGEEKNEKKDSSS